MTTEDDDAIERDRPGSGDATIGLGASAPPEPLDGGTPDDSEAPDREHATELRDLLRGVMLGQEPEIPDVLRGVQRKIRRRSGGKFFSDGWSTAREPPTQTYLVTSALMLAVVIAIWIVLYPISGAPVTVAPPAPVNVIPPP